MDPVCIDSDALIAQQLYEEELRCINDEQIAEMYRNSDQQAVYDRLKQLQSTNTSFKAMTIEENTAYFNLYGKHKYKGLDDEDSDFYVSPRSKPKNIYEFRYKKKGEEYAVVVRTEGVKRGIICECLDGKRRSCYRSKFFDAYFKNLSRGDAVLIQVRDDEKGKLNFRYTAAHWNKLYAGGHLSRLEGFNRLSDEVVYNILKSNFDPHTPWFASLQLVNTVFRDIVQQLRNQPRAPSPTTDEPTSSPTTPLPPA